MIPEWAQRCHQIRCTVSPVFLSKPAPDGHARLCKRDGGAALRRPPAGLYDLPQRLRLRRVLALRKIADDVLAGDDAGEVAQIVYHGDEVLVHGALQKRLHADSDADGRIVVAPEDVPDPQLFHVLHGIGRQVFTVLGEQAPEKVPLTDRADVCSLPADDRDGGVAVVPHLFQSLAEGAVVIEICDRVLREQKISYVHVAASFLRAGAARIEPFRLSE